MKLKTILCLMLFCSTCLAQDGATKSESTADTEPELRAELVVLKPYLGTWVIDTKLKDGRPLWAMRQTKPGMNGNFVVVETFLKNEVGEEYRQYHAIWRWDQESRKIVSHRFKHDGTYESTEIIVATSDEGRPAITTILASPGSPVAVEEAIKLIDEKSYRWKVSSSVTSENPIMEGVWKKQ